MRKDVFEAKIRPILTYVGAIGAVITSVAYIILMVVLIRGFEYHQTTQTLLFALINAAVGLIIANFLKYQGIAFAKELPENEELCKEYYSLHTKDKKNHSLNFFWITSIVKDILVKGLTIAISTAGLIYIVIVGSNDWTMLGIALVNLLLFICFGLLALNKSYDYFNNIYVNYMKDRINEAKNNTSVEMAKKKPNKQRDDSVHSDRGNDILDSSMDTFTASPYSVTMVVDSS